ncbi:hypothetical protein [Victivallis sp. Marseille-Q1083]|uniref:hypothetical protein n=1 Tax=Victivallis sp. Marseille-Q1083 TaxID=2717288 RepID=UPI00158D2D22|nr:hypothetical protein [Victivallis sp. Marseille-Q1083]
MMNRIALAGLLLFAVLNFILLCGCSHTILVPEVLQQQLDEKIYTACNLWVQDPDRISCLNIQQGRLLPVGTAVDIVEASTDRIVFTDPAGTRYTIRYDAGTMMLPIEEYIRQIFTLQPPEKLLAGIDPATVDKIRRGVIEPGMTGRDVLLAYGYPVASRTPSLANSSWLYWVGPDQTVRIIFRGDKVTALVNSK